MKQVIATALMCHVIMSGCYIQGCRDVLPADEELRQAVVPVPDHGQHGEAAQDDEDRRDPQGHLGPLPERTLPRRRRGEGQDPQGN